MCESQKPIVVAHNMTNPITIPTMDDSIVVADGSQIEILHKSNEARCNCRDGGESHSVQ